MNKILGFSVAALFMLLTFSSFSQSEELGLASYYNDKFQGSKTAYGDIYDRNKFTCAHKRYKYGTKLRVTRIDNKKSVIVKVTDKGPFIKGRVVDLSYVAAEKIGLIQDGVTEVKVEVVGKAKKEDNISKSTKTKDKSSEIVTEPVRPSEYDNLPKRKDKPNGDSESGSVKKTTSTTKKPNRETPVALTLKDKLVKVGVFKISTSHSIQQYAVQVASLNNYDNAARHVATLQNDFWFKNVLLMAEPKGDEVSYKVLLGPFDSGEAAKRYQASLDKKNKIKGFIVSLPVESQTTAKGGEPTESSTRNVLLNAPEKGNYGVQVASLDSFDAALRQSDILKAKWFKNILVKIEADSFKVILGPQADEAAAKNYQNSLAKNHKIKGFVVKLTD